MGDYGSVFTMNTSEIVSRLKVSLALVVGFALGKLAASWDIAHYSALFSAGFLAGSIGFQAALRLFELWLQKKTPK
jgi:hypothetical protein